MTRKTIVWAGAFAAISSTIFTFVHVDPEIERIFLSQIILEMSGGKLGFSLIELMAFVLQMFPIFIFCAIMGTGLYKHLCFSSVYIFSRHSKKMKWYTGELFRILSITVFFQLFFILFTLFIAGLLYDVMLDIQGFQLMVIHLAIYSLWIYCMVLSINLAAIFLGSDGAFAVVTGIQMILFASFSLSQQGKWSKWMMINPNAGLVMSWHDSVVDFLNLEMPAGNIYPNLDIMCSVGIMLTIAIVLSLLGGVIITKHDILLSNMETGGA